MIQLKLIWDILRGKAKPPPAIDMERVERDQNNLEPIIRDLERAAEFRKWHREQRHEHRR